MGRRILRLNLYGCLVMLYGVLAAARASQFGAQIYVAFGIVRLSPQCALVMVDRQAGLTARGEGVCEIVVDNWIVGSMSHTVSPERQLTFVHLQAAGTYHATDERNGETDCGRHQYWTHA